ncbi:MAG: hypothetical protein KF729_03735 [Sandaracinaceae bacterium]|nr:hypothetical protein [Sandaracinaceae bacterium]
MSQTALARRPETALERGGDRFTWLEILRDLSNGQREALMHAGVAPRFEDLVGAEFAGANTLPIVRLVGIRKFCKGFYEGPPRSAKGPEPFVQGYNIPVVNDADDAPHRLEPSPEKPKRFGFYRVHRVVEGARDARYPNGLLLDYSLGGNGLFGPPLRDYLVQVYPDDPDLLLGKAYLALAGLRIPLSFFVLKRLRAHDFAG